MKKQTIDYFLWIQENENPSQLSLNKNLNKTVLSLPLLQACMVLFIFFIEVSKGEYVTPQLLTPVRRKVTRKDIHLVRSKTA